MKEAPFRGFFFVSMPAKIGFADYTDRFFRGGLRLAERGNIRHAITHTLTDGCL